MHKEMDMPRQSDDTRSPCKSTGGSRAQNLPPGAYVPRHGNGYLRPWKPGQSGSNGARGDAYLACQRLAREASPEAMRKLIMLMDDPDKRVATVAIQGVLDRAWGKPQEYDPRSVPDDVARLDVGQLSREELETLLAITRRGAVRQAAPDDDASMTTVPTVLGAGLRGERADRDR